VKRIVVVIVVLAVIGGIGALAVQRARSGPPPGTLYGNVEIREVNLGFNAEGTVRALLKREGDAVKAGDLLAELDDGTYRHGLALAVARRDQSRAQYELLKAGTRAEVIDQARATAASAAAVLANAETTYLRQEELARRDVNSRQAFDDALRARDAARAQAAQTRAALAQAEHGPLPLEIEAAAAGLRAAEATVDLVSEQLAHARLLAPSTGIITTRVVEPGTVVLPGGAIYAMAITGETWVRGFAPEPLLGRVAPGTVVKVEGDGGKSWSGKVGYVSPVAEFTPKTVETPELRTQLVYRFRVRIEGDDGGLRQGMPVTITLPGGG